MKTENIITIVLILIFLIPICYLLISSVGLITLNREHNEFCESNGYESWRLESCVKIENGTMIVREVRRLDGKNYFVEKKS